MVLTQIHSLFSLKWPSQSHFIIQRGGIPKDQGAMLTTDDIILQSILNPALKINARFLGHTRDMKKGIILVSIWGIWISEKWKSRPLWNTWQGSVFLSSCSEASFTVLWSCEEAEGRSPDEFNRILGLIRNLLCFSQRPQASGCDLRHYCFHVHSQSRQCPA